MLRKFNLRTFKLKILINFSRNIPSVYKYALKSNLIHQRSLEGTEAFHNSKYLFRYSMFFRSYDLFTSLILSVHYGNKRSLEILLRSLIENYIITEYLANNPEEIKYVFYEDIYNKRRKKWKAWTKKFFSSERWLKSIYYEHLSKQAHPTQKGFLSEISFMSFMRPKTGINFDFKEFLSMSPEQRKKVELEKYFDFIPSPGLQVGPHNNISKEEAENITKIFLGTFVMIKENLEKIIKICPDHKIEDWDNVMRKGAEK